MTLGRSLRLAFTIALLTACGPSVDAQDAGASGDATSADLTTSSSTSDATTQGSATDSLPECGDADLDPGEACDDGNEIDGDGCNRDCSESGAPLWSVDVGHDACVGFGADVGGQLYVLTSPRLVSDPETISKFGPAHGELEWSRVAAPPEEGGGVGELYGLRQTPGVALVGAPDVTSFGSWRQVRNDSGDVVFEATDNASEFVDSLGIGGLDDLWLFAEVYVDNESVGYALSRFLADGSLDWRRDFDPAAGASVPPHARGRPHPSGDMILIGAVDASPAVARLSAAGDTVWTTSISVENGTLDDLAVAATGDIYVARYELPPAPGEQLVILAYEDDGVFSRSFLHSAPEIGEASYGGARIDSDYAGGVVVVSQVDAEVDSGKDRWVISRYLSSGLQTWAHVVPPLDEPAHGTATACGIVVDASGRVVVAISTHDDDEYTTRLHAFAL